MPRSHRSQRAATLVEVLASLAILGTLIVGALMVRARCLRQWRLAEERLQAVTATNELLAAWWTGDGIPRSATGVISEESNLVWKTEVLQNSTDPAKPFDIVRLSVSPQDQEDPQSSPITVDLVLPSERTWGDVP